MRALVTGAAGFIGGWLAERLLDEHWEVAGLDIREGAPGRPVAELVDINSYAASAGLFEKFRPEVVFHLAAKVGVRESLNEPLAYFRVNVGGTCNVLECARRCGASKVVLVSSSSVYGATKRFPMSESDPCVEPLSPYAASKRAMELAGWTWHSVYGMDVSVVRPFSVYGPGCRPQLVVREFITAALRGQPVEIYGDGEATRDFAFVSDVVQGIVLASQRPGWGIYNLSGGREISINELIATLERVLGAKIKKRYGAVKPGELRRTKADLSNSRQKLGYEPRTRFEDGIKATVEWYRKNLIT